MQSLVDFAVLECKYTEVSIKPGRNLKLVEWDLAMFDNILREVFGVWENPEETHIDLPIEPVLLLALTKKQ